MNAEDRFVGIAALICEPARAKMLWRLLDGRAYTASELSIAADLSASSASNHLAKLLKAEIVKVDVQGKHRYYSLFNMEVAQAVEGLALLAKRPPSESTKKPYKSEGVQFCRTCYDHLAGYVGVSIVETFEANGYLEKLEKGYMVSEEGWRWLLNLDIKKGDFVHSRRPLTRQCLDWSERRPHLAGHLGSVLLARMLERKWFRRVAFSRVLTLTLKGRQELDALLGLVLP